MSVVSGPDVSRTPGEGAPSAGRLRDAAASRIGSFHPDMVARMIAAYGAAVAIVEDLGGPFALAPSRALRERIADAVLREARAGSEDVDQLKAAALRTVCLDQWMGDGRLAS